MLLSRIRRQLDAAVLITEHNTVQFDTQSIWVAYAIFQQQLSGDLSRKSINDLETAVALYRGEFLEGLTLPDALEFELWLLGQRAQTRQLLEYGLLTRFMAYPTNARVETAVFVNTGYPTLSSTTDFNGDGRDALPDAGAYKRSGDLEQVCLPLAVK
ncbi:MAG: hypothetical protein P8183_08400 [Anaerolineae bacterium]